MTDLMKEHNKECVIPHVREHLNGVWIETESQQVLRLTKSHLVHTERGLIRAEHLRIEDKVYTSLDEKETTKVTLVKEDNDQTYFGLNCHVSEVLANGIKTSTFGNVHSIPAFWMTHVSKIIGIQRASAIGDSVANILARLGFIN